MSLVVRRFLPRQIEAAWRLLLFQNFKRRFNGTRGTLGRSGALSARLK
jgi:hypothetical protein